MGNNTFHRYFLSTDKAYLVSKLLYGALLEQRYQNEEGGGCALSLSLEVKHRGHDYRLVIPGTLSVLGFQKTLLYDYLYRQRLQMRATASLSLDQPTFYK